MREYSLQTEMPAWFHFDQKWTEQVQENPSSFSRNFHLHYNNYLKWICNCMLEREICFFSPNSTLSEGRV